MAFIAPIIGAAIGGIATSAIGQAVIGVGLSIGANYLTRRTKPEKSSAPRGMSLSLRVENNEFREVILGRAATAGSLKYHNTYGPNGNDYLQLVFVLADHECDGLAGMFVDGKEATFGSDVTSGPVTGLPVNEYPGAMWVKFHSGAWDQTADADLVAENGSYSSDFRARGICYARVTIKYDAQKFPNGVPSFLFVMRGAKLYDWRKDSTAGGDGAHVWGTPSTYEYSENPAVCLYNWMRGIYVNGDRIAGMNARGFSFPLADWTAAANACDETVNLAGGGSELRYRMGGVVPVDTQNSTVISEILASMAGELVDSGGVFRPIAGVAQPSVMTITDDDLMADDAVEITPKLSRGSLINAVFGTFQDPSQVWEAAALPPRISPEDEAADGDIRLEEHYNLGFVWSGTQGQRICEILRRKGRFQRQASLKLRSRFAVLEAGDWVTWNSDRYGYDGVKWEVVNAALNRDLTVTLQIRETSDSIFAWTAATDELDPDDPQPVSAGGSSFDTVEGLSVENALIESGGTSQRPGIHIEWTPIDDATVVEIELEFRRVGDTAAQSRKIFDPSAGSYTWVDGIQGGTEYEVRVRPVTLPPRPVVWTSWVSPEEDSAAQVVEVAAIAIAVPPDTITPEMLDEQSRFELGLITALAEIQGSAAGLKEELNAKIIAISEALAETQQRAMEQGAFVRTQEIIRQTDTESFARQLTEVGAALEGKASAAAFLDLVAAVETVSEDLTEARARATIGVNVDNQVIGLIDIAGNLLESVVTILADKFLVAKPDGTGATQILTVGTTPLGESRVGIDGSVVINGTLSALALSVSELSAIVANLGTITAGRLQNADNTSYWDLDTGDFQIG